MINGLLISSYIFVTNCLFISPKKGNVCHSEDSGYTYAFYLYINYMQVKPEPVLGEAASTGMIKTKQKDKNTSVLTIGLAEKYFFTVFNWTSTPLPLPQMDLEQNISPPYWTEPPHHLPFPTQKKTNLENKGGIYFQWIVFGLKIFVNYCNSNMSNKQI